MNHLEVSKSFTEVKKTFYTPAPERVEITEYQEFPPCTHTAFINIFQTMVS